MYRADSSSIGQHKTGGSTGEKQLMNFAFGDASATPSFNR
jgi:hypothetical protein